MTISTPQASEIAPFYAGYVAKVGPNGPEAVLNDQLADFGVLRALPDAQGDHRDADGKWTVKELIGHVCDTERVFAYRLLRIARADETPLPGFDENQWASAAPHATRRLVDVVDEMVLVRRSTLALLGSMDEAALSRTAVVNGNPVSARAICWVLAGHPQHHLAILRERYGLTI